MGTPKNGLAETIIMGTHNTCSYVELFITVSVKKKNFFHFSPQSYGVFPGRNERLNCPNFAFQ